MKSCAKLMLALLSLVSPDVVFASCSTMEGTYQIEGSPYKIFIEPVENYIDNYNIMFEIENKEFVEKKTIPVDIERRKKENIPECALLIPEVGMLVKANKGDKVNVMTQSQNYMNEKTLTGDYALWIFGGFYSNVVNVNKLSHSGSIDKTLTLQNKQDADPKQTNYKHELALATELAKKNNAAAQLFMAKSSSLVKYGFDSNNAGFWYARNSDAETRQHWLDKSLSNDYGPAYCYQAATKGDNGFKFTKEQRITLYKKAFSKGNAPLSGVYLADLTSAIDKKINYLVGAANQGSFVAIWRLAKLTAEEQNQLPDNIKEMIKKPPMDKLKATTPDVYSTYENSASSYYNVTGKDWRKDIYLFPLEDSIQQNQSYGETGMDLDYNQTRADCIERTVIKLSDYPL